MIFHQRGLGVGAELLHTGAVKDEAQVSFREVGLAEFGGGDGGVEGEEMLSLFPATAQGYVSQVGS
jgi:hypothetical protein